MNNHIPLNSSSAFSRGLLAWDKDHNQRVMPWKGEKDPYRIWLSEIILQQTRVEQGWTYYTRFIVAYPDIRSLALAPEQEVFKLWEGLGYYTRCRNLLATARYIAFERNGIFPETYEEILQLKGVGPYTAAAISSFAFNLPHAVVDGNVFRVLARITGDATPVDSTEGKNVFTSLATRLLDKEFPGRYNQAMMDFGALICKPRSPRCEECPFSLSCVAKNQGTIDILPVKAKKIKPRKRWFYYIVIEHGDHIAIRKRVEKDIWQDLYEFPLVESDKQVGQEILLRQIEEKRWMEKGFSLRQFSPLFKQQLTHQSIAGRFITIRLDKKPGAMNDWIWIRRERIGDYPFPGYINQFLRSAEAAVNPA